MRLFDRWREVVQSPNFGVNFRGQNNEELGGQFSGVATCTSGLPVIREFVMSADCHDAIGSNLQNSTKLEQNTFELNLTGDLLTLPAGTLQFSLGAGYRDEIYEFNTDNLTTSESFVETALGLYPTSNTYGEFDTKELYGELLVPVLSGLPGIQDLSLELGARISDYSTVGEVDTYKALLDWTIVDWARLRGGYQRANRAPNIGIDRYEEPPFEMPTPGSEPLQHPPVVVGSGPAGLAAAYFLAEQGYRPLVLERGGGDDLGREPLHLATDSDGRARGRLPVPPLA